MTNLQQVIDESRPMLHEFLSDLGLQRESEPLKLAALLGAFSNWLSAQEVSEEDFAYLASRIAAFICEYIIEGNYGTRVIKDNRILIHMPIQAGVIREFDPYRTACCIVSSHVNLEEFLKTMCNGK